MKSELVPLIIHGEDITSIGDRPPSVLIPDETARGPLTSIAPIIDDETCRKVVESCALAFESWKKTRTSERRALFSRLASVSGIACHAL